MFRFLFPLAAAAILAHSTVTLASEEGVTRLVEVAGNVIVSHAMTMSSVNEGHVLAEGARVLVTGNSRATVQFANGCRVHLEPGAHYEVRPATACQAGPRS